MPEKSTNREQGFTLVELLIAITVSGLLISAMVFGFITTMRGTAGAHDRFVASNGNHTLATYFASDVQSANATVVSTDPTSTSGCATTEASTTNVLRVQWWEKPTLTTMNAFSVSYRTRQVGGTWQLVRYSCSGSLDPYTMPEAILNVATPTSQVMASPLYDPSSPTYPTTAINNGREVTLQTYAALGENETVPYGYNVSARLRTLSGGTTTTTTAPATTTTTGASTTTTTTAPATAAKLGFVSCVRGDGVSVSCSGPINLANGQWIDISVQLRDASGNAVNATSDVTVGVSSDGAKFVVTGAPVTIPAGTSQSSGPFRVTHSNGGNATITATSGSLTPASVAMN
jgi:prepilin-type N-terminal cleavage/methylation domain-containing protein